VSELGGGNGRRQMGPAWQTEKREGARGAGKNGPGLGPRRGKGRGEDAGLWSAHAGVRREKENGLG
jgi:hypothetical protein